MIVYRISFTIFSFLVAIVWAAMIFAPRWKKTHEMVSSLWLVVPFMLSYAILELPYITTAIPLFANPKLPKIMELLGTESGASLAWLHFIAADLFVGRWIYLDSRKHNMNVWLMIPILCFTALLCPLGFIIYIVVRGVTKPQAQMV